MYYTSIEQSEKLVELGLDNDTSDMYFIFDPFVGDIAGIGIGKPEEERDIPCWSLGRLEELLPKKINGEKLHIYLNYWSEWKYTVGYGNDDFENGTLFDSILECLMWVLENNLFEKE